MLYQLTRVKDSMNITYIAIVSIVNNFMDSFPFRTERNLEPLSRTSSDLGTNFRLWRGLGALLAMWLGT